MKTKSHIIVSLFIVVLTSILLVGCRLTGKLERITETYKPHVNQVSKKSGTSSSERNNGGDANFRFADEDKRDVLSPNQSKKDKKPKVWKEIDKDGTNITTSEIDEVFIYAKSKNVPERNGKVSLDFVVSVPKKIMDKRWLVNLTPNLKNLDNVEKLENLVINGEIYKMYQAKGERLYNALSERYNHFNRDTSNIHDHFYYKYNLQYYKNTRLDTIVSTDKNFEYYYKQEIEVGEAKKLDLHINGDVFAMDKSTFKLPLSDTITYYISSMMQFIDEAPRYVKRVIEKHAEANFSAHITFPQGKDIVDENLADNKQEIEKVKNIIHELTFSSVFMIDSINMTATASPEGSWRNNELLAKKRAKSLKDFFSKKLDDKQGVDTLLRAKHLAEDWIRLEKRVDESFGLFQNRDEILSIIKTEKDADRRENEIRAKYPKDYQTLRDSIYPDLRCVNFQFNLHRRGMTKDTIHTTVIDSVYNTGRELLRARKYKDALAVLSEYPVDYNHALTLMSLGYNQKALDIFQKQTETANRNYLIAILYSRLKDDEQAVEYYLSACKMDYLKIDRGLLDPEINRLITEYKLQDKLREIEEDYMSN